MSAAVVELHLYYYDKREWQSPTEHGNRKMVVVIPSGPTAVQMKIDVAKVLEKIIKRIHSYYIVAKVKKTDGSFGYRTIVPMVLM